MAGKSNENKGNFQQAVDSIGDMIELGLFGTAIDGVLKMDDRATLQELCNDLKAKHSIDFSDTISDESHNLLTNLACAKAASKDSVGINF